MTEALPPMPEHVRRTQIAYSRMITKVKDIICGENLTPEMALILAFVGDQTMTRADIERYGYFIGTSAGHSLKRLTDDGLIESAEGQGGNRRPVKLTPRGLRMAVSIRISLAMVASAKVYAAEVAA